MKIPNFEEAKKILCTPDGKGRLEKELVLESIFDFISYTQEKAIEDFLSKEHLIYGDDYDKPFAKITYEEEKGDSSVGLSGWAGFVLVSDQSGTELEEILKNAKMQMED